MNLSALSLENSSPGHPEDLTHQLEWAPQQKSANTFGYIVQKDRFFFFVFCFLHRAKQETEL